MPPSAYLVIIEADDDPIADPYTWSGWVSSAGAATDRSPCAPSPTRIKAEVTKRQPLRQGVRPRDVPTGVIQVGHRLEFRLLSDMLLGKDVASVDVMVEVLPDAVVASPPQP